MRNLLLSAVLICLTVALVHAQGDAAKLEGTWLLTGAVSDGKKVPDELFPKFGGKMVLSKDGTYEQSQMGMKLESGKYVTDVSKKPATIEYSILEGDDKGKKQMGIFKLDGDMLTIAVGKAGTEMRPKDFAGGKDVEVTHFKRGK